MRKLVCGTILGSFFSFGIGPALAAPVLPQKAFDIEGGIVAVEAGVMPSPDLPAGPFGNMKYPTRYFIRLINESPYPLWLDAGWTFPQKKQGKAPKPKMVKGDKVPPNGSYWFYSDKFSIIAEQVIAVDITAFSDAKRSNVIGSQHAELYFDQASADRFLASFPKLWTSGSTDTHEVTVISGWHDIPPPRTDMPGTLADEKLQHDIQLTIWKQDSIRNWSCEREVLSAEVMNADESRIVSSLPADARERAMLEQFDETLSTEKWLVRSCGKTSSYEVLLSASPNGGTDLVVLDTTDSADPGLDVPGSGAGDFASGPEMPAEETMRAEQPVDETSL